MSDKIINLFNPGNETLEEWDMEYSKAFKAYLTPFLKLSNFTPEEIIELGLLAWNMASIKKEMPIIFEQMMETKSEDFDIRQFNKMLLRKEEDFKSYDKFIVDFLPQIVSGNQLDLVKTTDLETFLNEGLNELNTDEDWEGPGFVDRVALVIKPKEPFFNWINNLYPDDQEDEFEESSVYLIEEKNSNEEAIEWLKKNFKKIFTRELDNWHARESDWPKKLTYKMFNEWFSIAYHSMVFDCENAPIFKDEE